MPLSFALMICNNNTLIRCENKPQMLQKVRDNIGFFFLSSEICLRFNATQRSNERRDKTL